MPDHPNPLGDDQGTRVGSPDPRDPSRRSQSTGAGSEAAEGIHGASTDRDPADRSSVENIPDGTDGRSGSEPLADRETEHRSGYGGSGGQPVRSSDQRPQ